MHVILVEALGLLVGLADADHLGETAAIGARILAAFRHPLPVDVHELLGTQVTRVAEIAIGVVELETEIVGLERAAARNEHRRPRPLDRLWGANARAQPGLAGVYTEGVC